MRKPLTTPKTHQTGRPTPAPKPDATEPGKPDPQAIRHRNGAGRFKRAPKHT